MSAIIPGIQRAVSPGVFSRIRSLQRAAAAVGGARILAIIGEGLQEEILVSSARGGGLDGVNSDFSGSDNPDGRHFQTTLTDLIPNRTSVIKNGVTLSVLETSIDNLPFDARYDCRLDVVNGRLEMQRSYLVAEGSAGIASVYYASRIGNIGTGSPTLTAASLIDTSAPAETWTVRCVAVVKNGAGTPITGQATFAVSGSVSGVIKDSNGNPIRWKSDGTTFSNGILSFSIAEGTVPFDVGDRFTIVVNSGVLAKNDELLVRYIATQNLEDPELFLEPDDLFGKHGDPSITNTLSLGAQMAFENGAPAVLALQAKPSVPRRTSATLLEADNPLTAGTEGASGGVAVQDTIFPLPLGARPDADTDVHIFVVNSDGTEEQLVLSKQAFYNVSYSTTTTAYSNFVTGPFAQAYTIIETPEVEESGQDGYVLTLSTTQIYFQSDTASFSSDRVDTGEGDLDKQLVLLTPAAAAATYTIDQIGDGYGDTTIVYATRTSGVHTAGVMTTSAIWELIDPADTGAQLAITDDVALANFTSGKGLRISYIDQDDADFYDTNWTSALQQLETVDCQIIVPLPTQTQSNIFQAARVHAEEMSATENKKERFLVIGALDGLTPDNLVGREDAAVEDIGLLEGIQGDDAEEVLAGNIEDLADYSIENAYGNTFRVQYMAPDEIVRNIAGQNTTLPGYYLAAALGGFYAGQGNPAEPATNKVLTGFSILRSRQYRQITIDELSAAGATVVQPVAGGGRIIWSKTTTNSGAPEEEESSVVAIRDQVSRALRDALQPFIGLAQSATLIAGMIATVTATLAGLVSSGLLQNYANVSVKRDVNETRQFNVTGTIVPVLGVNWIFIDESISL